MATKLLALLWLAWASSSATASFSERVIPFDVDQLVIEADPSGFERSESQSEVEDMSETIRRLELEVQLLHLHLAVLTAKVDALEFELGTEDRLSAQWSDGVAEFAETLDQY